MQYFYIEIMRDFLPLNVCLILAPQIGVILGSTVAASLLLMVGVIAGARKAYKGRIDYLYSVHIHLSHHITYIHASHGLSKFFSFCICFHSKIKVSLLLTDELLQLELLSNHVLNLDHVQMHYWEDLHPAVELCMN